MNNNLKSLAVCNPGYYESGGLCLECEIGTFKSELGDEACTPCGSLKTSETSGNTDNSPCGESNNHSASYEGASPCQQKHTHTKLKTLPSLVLRTWLVTIEG